MSKHRPAQRKSSGFHARAVNPSPGAPPEPPPGAPPEPPPGAPPEPPPSAQTEPPRSAQTAQQSRYHALKHGAYAASLDATAAEVGEDPAEVEALLADLWDCYAPEDSQEALVVQRLAATWRRLMRLSTHAQGYLRQRLAQGAIPFAALQESEAASAEEAKLERALLRLHRHLEFLQRWRVAAGQRRAARERREQQDQVAALLDQTHAEAQFLMAEARRKRAERAAAEAAGSAGEAVAQAEAQKDALEQAQEADRSGLPQARPGEIPPEHRPPEPQPREGGLAEPRTDPVPGTQGRPGGFTPAAEPGMVSGA
jgi:hypothetical protein